MFFWFIAENKETVKYHSRVKQQWNITSEQRMVAGRRTSLFPAAQEKVSFILSLWKFGSIQKNIPGHTWWKEIVQKLLKQVEEPPACTISEFITSQSVTESNKVSGLSPGHWYECPALSVVREKLNSFLLVKQVSSQMCHLNGYHSSDFA